MIITARTEFSWAVLWHADLSKDAMYKGVFDEFTLFKIVIQAIWSWMSRLIPFSGVMNAPEIREEAVFVVLIGPLTTLDMFTWF